jgi:hypothetical protein
MTNKVKHKRFDQNLHPVAANGFRCCEDIFNQLQNYETHFKIRKRSRKKVDQEIFQQTVYCIISNLVISALGNPESGVRITRSHSQLGTRNRYRTPVLWLVAMEIDIAADGISSEININNRKLRRYFGRGDLTLPLVLVGGSLVASGLI